MFLLRNQNGVVTLLLASRQTLALMQISSILALEHSAAPSFHGTMQLALGLPLQLEQDLPRWAVKGVIV